MKKLFSFDAETNGLWGEAFAIAAIVYDENGNETHRFLGRCPIEGAVDEFVGEKVLPQMTTIPVTHADYASMLADFAEFYLANKAGADVIVHMGVPVEARLIADMHAGGMIGDWDGPYPLIDISGNLMQAGENPCSVDDYAKKFDLEVRDFGSSHNPLFDSEVAARVFLHLRERIA
ncbi:hypothetical protein ACFL2B_02430 [Patescibacteria group bacterium]